MALRIIDGNPGSGKTFYAVRHFVKNFCVEIEDEICLKEGIVVITNIDSLKLPHLKIADLLNESGLSPDSFFSLAHQENIIEKKYGSVIYIIDEAQKLWRKNNRSISLNPVFEWFELHRHCGQDIYLITQAARKLPTDILDCVEYIVHSVPRSRTLTGEFRYKKISDGDTLETFAVRPDQKIFDLYQSSRNEETEKLKNPMVRTILYAAAASLVLAFGAGFYLFDSFHGSTINNKVSDNSQKENNGEPGRANKDIIIADKNLPSQPAVVDVYIPFITDFSRVGKNYVSRTRLIYHNIFISIDKFPYPLRKEGISLVATIPLSEAGDYLLKSTENDKNETM